MNLKQLRGLVLLGLTLFSVNVLAHHDYHHPTPEMWKEKGEVNWRSVKNFYQPTVDGYRLDFCYKANAYCGRAAANEFCRSKGFQVATQFHIERHVGETRNIANNHLNQNGCYDGFHFIRRRN